MKDGVTMAAADGNTQTKILIKVLPPGSIYCITIAVNLWLDNEKG
jgi:hypothetical protein